MGEGGILRGHALLGDRYANRDTAFTEEERDRFGLRGLLPPRVLTIEEQVSLELEHVRRKSDDLERYIGLAALQDRNETLFHRLLRDHLEELLPIVYTPTVGRACQEFSHILRRPRGVWLTPPDMGRFAQLLRDGAPDDEIRLIVVTDNERILGLGDQGAGGMPIPIGKLAIYTAAAGVPPTATLPVSLDVGTDNPDLLADPLYLGHPAPRLRGPAYDEVVEAFIEAVKTEFPRAVLQWEDFKGPNALALLARYRHRLASFNDDIQGTAAVALGGLLAAERALGSPLAAQRVLLVGAGAAGVGIARILRHATDGTGSVAVLMVDREGLVHADRDLGPEKLPFAVDPGAFPANMVAAGGAAPLADIIEHWRPTVLIGTTGIGGRFDEAAIRALGNVTHRPVVMALSNPNAACEAAPEDVLRWTHGRSLVATGSPFDPVAVDGRSQPIGQANNAFVFPGLGLGAIVAEAREITDNMLVVAARTLAASVPRPRLEAGSPFPAVSDLPAVARAVASAIVREARDSGFGRHLPDEDLGTAVAAAAWEPAYAPLAA
ncbi:MAG TPA: NAD-dependent malic enzyme [Candidatus Limnocylindria bacterium]|nr:NAD-dependent malic enzyme [Candidatus Limnocylindria bacterium]